MFAKRTLPKRSCFGPFIAEMVHELPQDYPGIMLKVKATALLIELCG